MEWGFVVDFAHMKSHPAMWVEGDAEISQWTGHVKIKGKRTFYLSTTRCTGCGFLESYANAQLNPKK